jgi:hypothetical protein
MDPLQIKFHAPSNSVSTAIEQETSYDVARQASLNQRHGIQIHGRRTAIQCHDAHTKLNAESPMIKLLEKGRHTVGCGEGIIRQKFRNRYGQQAKFCIPTPNWS